MKTVFLVSDTHFGHRGVCEFQCADGVTKLRPWTDPHEMDEDMISRWNARVSPRDKVYHLGDVAISRRSLSTLSRLNGDKVLIKGNHDIYKLSDYAEHFRDIRAYHVLDGMIMSHVPVHESALYRFGVNIHGHLHDRRVMKTVTVSRSAPVPFDPRSWDAQEQVIDNRYHCVCVEQTDFAPIALEEVQARIRAEGGIIGFRNGNARQAD